MRIKPFVLKQNEKLLNFPSFCLLSLPHERWKVENEVKNNFLLSQRRHQGKENEKSLGKVFLCRENLTKKLHDWTRRLPWKSKPEAWKGSSRSCIKSLIIPAHIDDENVCTITERTQSHQWFNRLHFLRIFFVIKINSKTKSYFILLRRQKNARFAQNYRCCDNNYKPFSVVVAKSVFRNKRQSGNSGKDKI